MTRDMNVQDMSSMTRGIGAWEKVGNEANDEIMDHEVHTIELIELQISIICLPIPFANSSLPSWAPL